MCNIDRYLDELTPIDKDSPWLGFVQSRKTTCGRETGQTDLAKECFCRGLRNATRQSGVRAWIATDEALAAGLGRLSAGGTAPGVYYYYNSSSTFTRRVPRVSCCLQLDGRERERERGWLELLLGARQSCWLAVCCSKKEKGGGDPRDVKVFSPFPWGGLLTHIPPSVTRPLAPTAPAVSQVKVKGKNQKKKNWREMRPGKTRRKRTAVYRNEMRNVLDCFSFGQVHLTEPLNGFFLFCFQWHGLRLSNSCHATVWGQINFRRDKKLNASSFRRISQPKDTKSAEH